MQLAAARLCISEVFRRRPLAVCRSRRRDSMKGAGRSRRAKHWCCLYLKYENLVNVELPQPSFLGVSNSTPSHFAKPLNLQKNGCSANEMRTRPEQAVGGPLVCLPFHFCKTTQDRQRQKLRGCLQRDFSWWSRFDVSCYSGFANVEVISEYFFAG